MRDGQEMASEEIPLSWFGKTLWRFTPLYGELVFLAICLRLIGLVEPFIFQVIIDRILPFQREASLIVVVAIFVAVSLFQLGFEVLSQVLGFAAASFGKVEKHVSESIPVLFDDGSDGLHGLDCK